MILSDVALTTFCTIPVTQPGYSPGGDIAVSPETLDASMSGESGAGFTVTSGLAWDVLETPGWVEATKLDDTTLSVSVAPNSESPRSGDIVLSNGVNDTTIHVSQAGNTFIFRANGDGSIVEDGKALNYGQLFTDGTTMNFGVFDNTPNLSLRPVSPPLDYSSFKIGLDLSGTITQGLLATLPVGEGYGMMIQVAPYTTGFVKLSFFDWDYQTGQKDNERTVFINAGNNVELEVRQEVDGFNLYSRVYVDDSPMLDITGAGTWDFSDERPVSVGYEHFQTTSCYPCYGVKVHYIEIA